MSDAGRYDSLVALHVTDDAGYARYRTAMTPILETFGGRFVHDFVVAETLRTDADHPVNRVFVISFPDAAAKAAFFADPAYLAVRAEHFDASVGGATVLAEHAWTPPPPRG